MTSLDALTAQIVAAQRAANVATPTSWVPEASQVAPSVVRSPAASVPTGWSSTPAGLEGAGAGASGLSLEQVILSALAQQQAAEAQQRAAAAAVRPAAVATPAPTPTPSPAVAPTAVTPTVRPAVATPTVAPVTAVPAAAAPVVAPVASGAAAAPVSAQAQLAQTVASAPSTIAAYAAATGRAVANVAGSGVSRARKVGTEIWAGVRNPRSVHVTQVPSKYNENPAAGNKDCGPTSVVMALKLVGRAIPGVAANASPQRLINRIRELSGNTANTESTTNVDLERALQTAGAKTEEISDFASVKQSVLDGKPVILNGNPRNPGAYGTSFAAAQMTPYDGAHWITVSGFDEASGKFIINDPLSKIGPVKVTAAQLDAYRGGSMGIEVSA